MACWVGIHFQSKFWQQHHRLTAFVPVGTKFRIRHHSVVGPLQPSHTPDRHDADCDGAGVDGLDGKIIFSNTLIEQCQLTSTQYQPNYEMHPQKSIHEFSANCRSLCSKINTFWNKKSSSPQSPKPETRGELP